MSLVRLGCLLAGVLATLAGVVMLRPSGAHSQPAGAADKITSGQVEHPFLNAQTRKEESAWKVGWKAEDRHGLIITGAWFRPAGKTWLKVLGDSRVSDIFVPYQPGEPRYWDLSANNATLLEVTAVDVNEKLGDVALGPYVVKEDRDRGVVWKHLLDGRKTSSRRGRELVLWATLRVGNYAYVIRYGFQDDGTITFRAAATGHNLPDHALVSHLHNVLWRVDVELNVDDGNLHNRNSVRLMRHQEPRHGPKAAGRDFLVAVNSHEHFNMGVEGPADWKADEFTMLRIIHDRKESPYGRVAYDLMPHRHGNARHFGHRYSKVDPYPDEETLLHDFWVTRYHSDELRWRKLRSYVADKEPIEKADIVLWVNTPMHHEPRAEDGRFVTVGDTTRWRGVTPLMWTGFDLRPRDLFESSPFYPDPPPSKPDPAPRR